jgi:hypothetical protein
MCLSLGKILRFNSIFKKPENAITFTFKIFTLNKFNL